MARGMLHGFVLLLRSNASPLEASSDFLRLELLLFLSTVRVRGNKVLLTRIVLCHEPAQNHANTTESKASREDCAEGVRVCDFVRLTHS